MTTARVHVVLGFDVGLRRIGMATGDTLTQKARPLQVLHLPKGQPDWVVIAAAVATWCPSAFVVGVPRHADGSDNAVTGAALRFARQLQRRFGLPVSTIDEHLSSWEASQRAPTRRTPRHLDAEAAAVILESWLAYHQERPS